MTQHTRKVGERGQVTIPKELRDRRGIESGDEVEFVESDNTILIKAPADEERLAEGYRKRSERAREFTDEMSVASAEATEQLEDAPRWSE